MQQARADWVAFIDNHDTLSPHYVELLMREIHKDSELEMLYLWNAEIYYKEVNCSS